MTHISNFKLFPLEIYVVLIDIITDTNKIKERPSRVRNQGNYDRNRLATEEGFSTYTIDIFGLDNCGKLSYMHCRMVSSILGLSSLYTSNIPPPHPI